VSEVEVSWELENPAVSRFDFPLAEQEFCRSAALRRWVCFRSRGRVSFCRVGCVRGRGFTGARESNSLTVRLSPQPTPVKLSSVSLVDSHRSEGPSSAPVSTVVGFAFSFHNSFSGACLTPQLCPEGSSQPFFAPYSGVVELGERLHSASLPLVPKPFQKYYPEG
jgi:hypothetical protein